jgi:hypothetical protein
MANFKLGANAITAAYLGTQGICIINDGADTVFDAACGAQFTVTHTISNNIGGTTNGYTISTSPGTTFTGEPGDAYSFTTIVSLNSGYRWLNGITPTISPSQPITGVVGPTNSTVTTTLSNATVELIPANVVRAQLNLNTGNINGPSAGYNITGNQNGEIQTGTNSLTYNFNSGTQLVSGYEWVGGAPSNATATGTITTPGTTQITASFGSATIQLIQYSVTAFQQNSIIGPTAGYNLSFNGTAKNTTGLTSVTETGTINDPDWSFTTTLSGPNANYQADAALAMTGSDGSSGLSITTTGAWGDTTDPETVTSTGTVSLITPNAVVLGSLGTCANDACINPGVTATWYYFGNLQGAILWSNSDGLTGSNPSNGYYNRGSVALLYSGGVSQATVSCYSSVSYIALGDGGSSVTACNDTLSDFFYVTGSTNPQAMNGVWNTSDACTGAGAKYYSDGVGWNQTNSGGLVINVGTC